MITNSNLIKKQKDLIKLTDKPTLTSRLLKFLFVIGYSSLLLLTILYLVRVTTLFSKIEIYFSPLHFTEEKKIEKIFEMYLLPFNSKREFVFSKFILYYPRFIIRQIYIFYLNLDLFFNTGETNYIFDFRLPDNFLLFEVVKKRITYNVSLDMAEFFKESKYKNTNFLISNNLPIENKSLTKIINYFSNLLFSLDSKVENNSKSINLTFNSVIKSGGGKYILSMFLIIFSFYLFSYLINMFIQDKSKNVNKAIAVMYNFSQFIVFLPLGLLSFIISKFTNNYRTTLSKGRYASIILAFFGVFFISFLFSLNSRQQVSKNEQLKFIKRNRLIKDKMRLEYHFYLRDFLYKALFENYVGSKTRDFVRGSTNIIKSVGNDFLSGSITSLIFSSVGLTEPQGEKLLSASINGLLFNVFSLYIIGKIIGILGKLLFKLSFFGTKEIYILKSSELFDKLYIRTKNKKKIIAYNKSCVVLY